MCIKKDTSDNPVAAQEENDEKSEKLRAMLRVDKCFGVDIHWFNRFWVGLIHLVFFYRIYSCHVGYIPRAGSIILFEFIYGYIGGLGVTVGCHRYWTHKSFKANRALQVLMMIMQTIAFQHSIFKWTIDHRIHHKYTDTDMDPHNSKRGFWFSQMGWVLSPKHPELQKKLRSFRMPDLENDPVVRFQSQYYWELLLIFHFLVPMSIVHYVWGWPWFFAFASNCSRHCVSLHFASLVNSAAHIWGYKPYDRTVTATDNKVVAFLAAGEGWHNYHHTFPWDYKAAEFGWRLNMSTMFIDFFAWLGWAYDLKTVSGKMLKERQKRTGDEGHCELKSKCDGEEDEQPFWGWDDERLPEEMRKMTTILRPVGSLM